MKISVKPDDSGSEKVIVLKENSNPAGQGVDAASLWTLLAIIFFGAFILMFIFFNKFSDINDGDIDPIDDPIDIEDPIDIDSDLNSDLDDSSGSTSDGVEDGSSATWEGEDNTPMGP